MDNQQGLESEPLQINHELAQRIQEELGENVYLCYQCVKCTSGCPVAAFMDWQPNQIMRALQFGQEDIALQSETPWLCAACQTCTTRCPQGIDINAIMEFLTREALDRGYQSEVPEVKIFNEAFIRQIKLWGRSYEPGLLAEMNLRTKDLFANMDYGLKLIRKNKVSFLPTPARPPKKVTPIPGAEKSVAYYPGCSLHSTAKEFDTSTRAVCAALDLQLVEPAGWVCCGSSAAHRADPGLALTLPMENLAVIEQSGFKEVTMPCAACFNRHKAAQYEIQEHPEHKAAVDREINYEYQNEVQVTTLVQSIVKHVGLEQVGDRVKEPLEGLRVVCYYGCLLTRPPEVTGSDHPENPTDMDQLMASLGAEVLDWSFKTSCCGAAHASARTDIVVQLSGNLIQQADEVGADLIVVACPLCHMNLDGRQFQMGLERPMPVLYFTQLMAVALGLPPEAAMLKKNLTDPRPLLAQKGFST